MKQSIKQLLGHFDVAVSSTTFYERTTRGYDEVHDLFDFLLAKNGGATSRAQLKQDVFALIVSNFRRGGFFVEFGATNGVDLSNSWLLEKEFDWNGILAEPSSAWHRDLADNRECVIDQRCVWSKSGELLEFVNASNGEYSTISSFATSDIHEDRRQHGDVSLVPTVSLEDLLDEHRAPSKIDFLSVDTEGSELEILEAFDFSKYEFGFIAVEHNYDEGKREGVRKLMSQNGYARVFDFLSRWDDWYLPIDEIPG